MRLRCLTLAIWTLALVLGACRGDDSRPQSASPEQQQQAQRFKARLLSISSRCRPADVLALQQCPSWVDEVSAPTGLPSERGPEQTLQVTTALLESSDLQHRVVAAAVLKHRLLPALERCLKLDEGAIAHPAEGSKGCGLSVVSVLRSISASGKLRGQLSAEVTRSIAIVAAAGQQVDAYAAMLKGHEEVETRAAGYTQLLLAARARALPIILALPDAVDPRVLTEVMAAARGLVAATDMRDALCRWGLSWVTSNRPRVAQSAGLLLIECGDGFVDTFLESGFERLRRQRLSVPLLRAIREVCGRPSSAPAAQCLRAVTLLGAIAGDQETPSRLRGEAIQALKQQRSPDEVKLVHLERLERDASPAIRERARKARLELTGNPSTPGKLRPPSPWR